MRQNYFEVSFVSIASFLGPSVIFKTSRSNALSPCGVVLFSIYPRAFHLINRMSELLSPKSNKSQSFSKDAMTSSVNNDSKDNNNFSNPVTSSNGGAPMTKNAGRGAVAPNSAQKKEQGAITLAALFNGRDNNEEDGKLADVEVEAPALEPITEDSSNSGSFETDDTRGSDNNNLGVGLDAGNGKRKVGKINSEEHHDPLVKYVENECGIVPPPPIPQQQQQQSATDRGGNDDASPRKKMRRSADPMNGLNNALPNPRSAAAAAPGQVCKPVVSTPQKVASILASQLPKTSVPPGVPMPRLPQQYLPPSSGKTSFEQLMQVSRTSDVCIFLFSFSQYTDKINFPSYQATTMTSPVPSSAAAGQPVYRSLPTQWSAQRAASASMPYLNGQVPQQQQQQKQQEPDSAANSRKDKSLGVLCTSFMELYKDAPPNRDDNGAVVEIVEVAEHLGVKRRRIYDIINILESIDIVARVRKNTYRWHGTGDLPKFFAKLQRDAIDEQTRKANGTWVEDPDKPKTKGMATTCQKLLQIFLSTGKLDFTLAYAADIIMGPAAQAAEEAARAAAAAQAAARNPIPLPNPLAPPTLPDDPVSVSLPPMEVPAIADNDDIAAAAATTPTTTNGNTTAQKAMKTKVRRMYDIANVLQALGVLTKYNVGSTSQSNKPSLKWTFYLKPDEIAQYGASAQLNEGANI